jgi:hypothetical protein
MTKYTTETERPMPKRPSLSVFNRVLISLLLLGGAALLFRAGLQPLTGEKLTLETFQEPLQGAKSAQISLGGRSVDLEVGVQALAGLALVGTSYFPQNIKLTRSTNLEQKRLWVNLNATLPSWRFTFGLNWNTRSPRWNVQFNRELPTDLKVDLGSGDTALNLEGAILKSLNTRVGSGELKVTLPTRLEGDVALSVGSGDMTVNSALERPISVNASSRALSFEAQSNSGEQNLDLRSTNFETVTTRIGSGDLTLTLPNRSKVMAQLKTGSGELRVWVPLELKTGTLELNSGSGDVTVRVSSSTAIRATVSSTLEDFQAPRGYAFRDGVYLSPAALGGQPTLNLNLRTSGGNINLITEESP